MSEGVRRLSTRRGPIRLPAYFPVTTFGAKYPLDRLLQPYLGRLAPGVMVSCYYAREVPADFRVPLLVDSGGFASLFEGSRVAPDGALGVLEVTREGRTERTHPRDVLELQEQVADVAFTLDFPIPPGLGKTEARGRQRRTIANARWALDNRRRRDLPLYACVQAWDPASARACARAYAGAGFDGVAIGGLVPRAREPETVLAMVAAVRAEAPEVPLHVFGIGSPQLVERLFREGVDSVDSSSYLKLAAEGRLWGDPAYRLDDASLTERLHLALCNLATASLRTLPLSAYQLAFAPDAPHRPCRGAPQELKGP